MEISKSRKDSVLNVELSGHLDTLTSKDLEASLSEEEKGLTDIIFDFKKVDYISSAGLRVLLAYSKLLKGKEHIVINNANDVIKEIFKVTSFENFVTLK